MKLKINYLLIATTLLFLGACSFNKEVKESGVAFLQGSWNEDSIANKAQLVNYQHNHFTFTCDSFYLQINSFSTVNLQGGPCYAAKEWQEYAKGYYTLAKDTLKFDGVFVDKSFRYKPEKSCYRFGKFTENFLITQQSDSLINLKSLQTGLKHQLVLKQKGICK
jgi:hypothetical protein